MPISNPRNLSTSFRHLARVITAAAIVIFAAGAQAQSTVDGSHLNNSVEKRPLRIARITDRNQSDALVRSLQANVNASGGLLSYYGGPVLSNVQVVVVFWGNNVSPTVTNGIFDFYKTVTDSTYLDLLYEYSTVKVTPSGGHASSNQLIGHGTALGPVTINPSYQGSTIDDTVIQAELQKQILGGTLPTPTEDTGGNTNTLYAVYFPPGTTITEGGLTSCQSFCAYHGTSYIKGKGSQAFQYSVIPDFGPDTGCSQACGVSPNVFDSVTSASSHELAEALTDAQVGFALSTSDPLAWYSDSYGEVGDVCNGLPAMLHANGKSYTVQQVWSQSQGACVSGPGASLGTHGASSMPSGAPLSVTVTVQNSVGVTLPFYTGTIAFGSTDASAQLPANYTFSSRDGGSHTFSVVLNTLGNQQISMHDVDVSSIAGSLMTTVDKRQTITFNAIAQHTVGTKVALSASATSNLPVTFASLTATVCSVSGNTATMLSVGVCTIQASQAGNASYAAATPVSQNISVVGMPQSITFGSIAQQTVGAHVLLGPMASSHLPVALRSLTHTVCTVSGLTAMLVNVGTCTIQASQPGNAQYAAAPSVTQSFTVLPAAHFTITVTPTAEVVNRDAPGIVTIKLQSVGGFNGKVTLVCSGGPAETQCPGLPQTVNVNGTASVFAEVLFPMYTTPGTYTITFSGLSPLPPMTTAATFTVR